MGNGKDVKVWGDKWLLGSSFYGVVFPRLFLHEDTRGHVLEIFNGGLYFSTT